jgi:hypothetical protein
MLREDLIGVWSLVAWVQDYDDGRLVRPFGGSPAGTLMYTPGGHMSGVIASGDRPDFAGDAQWQASETERARAYSSFLAYAGTYTVDGDVVIHHVLTSLFPNWVGRDQRRVAEPSGDRLTLTGRLEEGTPEARTVRMSFERVE